MVKEMFCFQCEQTAGCTGCTGKAGVCGKTAASAGLQDQLTGELIGLARTAKGAAPTAETHHVMMAGMFATVTNVNFNDAAIKEQIEQVKKAGKTLAAKGGAAADAYDMEQLSKHDEDVRSPNSLILFGLRGMAAYAYHAMILGYDDDEVNAFLYEGLAAVGEDWGMEQLLPVVLKTGEINLKCMALLDQANTETYGHPAPTTVPLRVEKGPFIVITGHDL